jgi:hypothetical protein
MTKKSDEYKITLSGPGHTFERPISEDLAGRIINLVMTGKPGVPASSDARVAGNKTPPAGEITPKEFIAAKRPSNHYERIACLGYYLAHHRQATHFKTSDITKLNTEAASTRIPNPSLYVTHAANTYGYLSAAGRGKKQMTILGEAVVEALPNREEVKAAIAEHKPEQRRRRRVKRK